MDGQFLRDMARHQAWADEEHWKVLRANDTARQDAQIRKRLNHMVTAQEMLTTLARGEMPDPARSKERESIDELSSAMAQARQGLESAIASLDLDRMISLPRGPQGPFQAPAGVLLLQALTHSQHHRGQNASRMRELGITPPLTDYIVWYALGRP
jgi:uncharacterized damage-inducible protein DinB